MTAYYNEFDAKTAAWLRELIKRGLIADGEVDDRSITEVSPDDLRGFTQCHFFAGIGGWSYALRLAGWDDTRPVWTGSPPCQPFSAAGQRKGAADARNLWPVFVRLISECRPSTLFGEQVAAAIGNGWLDAVFADLESEGYACAATVLPACSVGAPHIRQRLWIVADSQRTQRRPGAVSGNDDNAAQAGRDEGAGGIGECRGVGELGNANDTRPQRRSKRGHGAGKLAAGATGMASPWGSLEWLPCADGKARPTKPGLFPLANGVSGRVGILRGAGNAITPQVAAQVIGAYMECVE